MNLAEARTSSRACRASTFAIIVGPSRRSMPLSRPFGVGFRVAPAEQGPAIAAHRRSICARWRRAVPLAGEAARRRDFAASLEKRIANSRPQLEAGSTIQARTRPSCLSTRRLLATSSTRRAAAAQESSRASARTSYSLQPRRRCIVFVAADDGVNKTSCARSTGKIGGAASISSRQKGSAPARPRTCASYGSAPGVHIAAQPAVRLVRDRAARAWATLNDKTSIH